MLFSPNYIKSLVKIYESKYHRLAPRYSIGTSMQMPSCFIVWRSFAHLDCTVFQMFALLSPPSFAVIPNPWVVGKNCVAWSFFRVARLRTFTSKLNETCTKRFDNLKQGTIKIIWRSVAFYTKISCLRGSIIYIFVKFWIGWVIPDNYSTYSKSVVTVVT